MKLEEWAGYKSQRVLDRHMTSLAFINGVVWKILMGNMGLDLTQFYKSLLELFRKCMMCTQEQTQREELQGFLCGPNGSEQGGASRGFSDSDWRLCL